MILVLKAIQLFMQRLAQGDGILSIRPGPGFGGKFAFLQSKEASPTIGEESEASVEYSHLISMSK